jgi:O-antigen/teichoic acid export membrane protein
MRSIPRSRSSRRAAGVIGALAYTTLAGATALYAFLVGAFACFEECDSTGEWQEDGSSWQWEAIVFLGVAAAVVALLVLVLALAVRDQRFSAVALAIHMVVLTTAGAFIVASENVSAAFAATWIVLTGAAGLTLILARRRRREENVAAVTKA